MNTHNLSTTLTTEELRQAAARLPRYPLSHLPTPLERMPRFSRQLGGPTVWIKRDDCTGLALGGNKTRHNEFVLGDALARGTDLFVWGAGIQSNNCRQTAAACAKAGIDCHLVLSRGSSGGEVEVQGNLLLDHLLGARVEIVDAKIGPEIDDVIAERAAEFRRKGRNVFLWDRHVVRPMAAVSYVLCLVEIVEQAAAAGFMPSTVYVCSAGSTGSGLALAAAALGLRFPVISVSPMLWPWDTREDMAEIANAAAQLMGIPTRLERGDIELTEDYIGPGYGELSTAGMEAIMMLARSEGILLDPVYTSKALAGLMDHVRHGRYAPDEHVVFVHTGGTPALFAMHEQLASECGDAEKV